MLFHVIEHGKRHIARLNPNDQIDLVALDELLGLLQPDLRIELIVLLDEFDLTPGDGPIDAVEIEVHSVQIVFAGISEAASIRIDVANPYRRLGLGEHMGCRHDFCYNGASRAAHKGAARNTAALRLLLFHGVSP